MVDPGVGFEGAAIAFEKALADRPDLLVESRYRVAGRSVRLRVIGPALAAELDMPMQHLRAHDPGPGRQILNIDIWDTEACRTTSASGDMDGPYGPFGQVSMSPDGRYYGEQRDHSAMWFDPKETRIVGCSTGTAKRSLDERARPFHKFFAIWLARAGVQCIHSGLVAHEGCGFLFVGSGGSGKTTSSISCFRAGMGYLGDDFVGLEQVREDLFLGYGMYGSCLVNSQHLKRFPDLDDNSLPPNHAHEDKSVVYMSPLARDRVIAMAPVAAIILPNVIGKGDTSFRPATRSEALLALAPSSIMSLPVVVDGALDRLAALVDAVPAYWLDLGADTEQIPAQVGRICDALARRATPKLPLAAG